VLKQRLITALILIPLTVWMLFALSTAGIAVVFGVIVLLAAWEWAGLSGWSGVAERLVYVLALAAATVLLAFVPILPVLVVGVIWWSWSAVEVFLYKDIHAGALGSSLGRSMGGFFILVPAWLATVHLHAADAHPPAALLYLLLLVWTADSTAYFAGKRWGRTKLAAHVSPGKSIEGLVGGMVGVLVLALLAGIFIWRYSPTHLLAWLVVALVTGLFSVVGDLVESKAKRTVGVKDSGHLLPGHGGVFDRIDALTAAAPVFALGSMLFSRSGA
jgi:phosphatidate cytidylyltransferase